MRYTLIQEMRWLKGYGVEGYPVPPKRSPDIEGRLEVVMLSMAYMENAFKDKHPNTSISFDRWVMKQTRYLDVLLKPIDGYKRVHEINKVKDAYYQEKIDAGLIQPFTEKELKKRSFSPKAPKRDSEDDDKPYYFLQADRRIPESMWFDLLTNGGTTERGDRKAVSFGESPETALMKKEEQASTHGRLTGAGFSPDEIETLTYYLEATADLEGKRGAKKVICDELDITRSSLNWLLMRLDKFIAICG